MKPPSRGWFWLAVVGVAAIVAFLHLYRLDAVPPGFFYDESSVGYNAYCLVRTGADEYGVRWPVFFRSFGEYEQSPLMVYAAALSIKAFGLGKWAVRFPSAVFLLLTAGAFAGLVYEYCRNRWAALAGAALFALSPWTFPVRPGMCAGYAAMLLGITLGWWFILVACRRRSHLFAAAAGLAWGMNLYAYHTA